ncbi:LCCL domain-containing protein [Verticillium alfalfae VaMs.102]|uniref:LCCL domain-containing protein n=1 Tax=Verticillium alfalfae (strain VaMs.102 / ATCC MYA-4576 / FGSC 10136) TaxID=526221 RepID=C9SFI4_VERA1|nr:LCCL domain-containing protein [Verticillium alfalfae VaMs.102]EEY17970.1 LCCL domain-containing protein [Verticillium alfalfae VaMs.102]
MSDDGFAENAPLLSSMERQEATERPAAERGDATATAADHPDAPIPDSTTTAQQRRELEVEDDSSTSTPRFLQDDRNGKRWKWGPQNPRDWKIKPVFPRIQEFPLLLVEKYLPKRKQRLVVVFFYVAIWAVTFALVKRAETLATEIEGWRTPSEIGCGATYWGAGNRCGINGVDCRPFNGSGFPF